MKYLYSILFTLSLLACGQNPKIEVKLQEDDIFYSTKLKELPKEYKETIGEWAKIGTNCYGIILLINEGTKQTMPIAVKCKIVSYHESGIKCKIMEHVYPYKEFGCEKIGLDKGSDWLEKDGELFKTKEEALAFIQKKYLHSPKSPAQ